jgi:hypothetical protein
MKTTNLPSGAQRNTDVGLPWIEVLTNAMGTIEVPLQGTIRVRATGATTVTVGGVLAMTMSAGEIERFNVGTGPADGKSFVSVTIAGAAAYVQVAKEVEKGRHQR